jgi:hypothetical protein
LWTHYLDGGPRSFEGKDGKMHGCRYLAAVLLGFALIGCSPEVSKVPVSSGQFIGGNIGETSGGFVQRGGGGGFGGGPQRDTILEGQIDGDYVLQRSGQRIHREGKAAQPLVIKFKSERLPLVPSNDEIGEHLLSLSGSRVRLSGQMGAAICRGSNDFGGQQGLGTGCPDHVISFLIVSTVEAL